MPDMTSGNRLKTWLDFEARFQSLAPRLKYTRLDDQTGAAGEYWRLAGGFDRESEKQFEALSHLAGNLLTETLAGQSNHERIISHNDPKVRWYRALKFLSGAHKPGPPAYLTDEAGENVRWIYGGSINHPAEVAANVCLQLQAHHPVRSRWYERLYEDYGKEIIIGLVLALATALIGLWLK